MYHTECPINVEQWHTKARRHAWHKALKEALLPRHCLCNLCAPGSNSNSAPMLGAQSPTIENTKRQSKIVQSDGVCTVKAPTGTNHSKIDVYNCAPCLIRSFSDSRVRHCPVRENPAT